MNIISFFLKRATYKLLIEITRVFNGGLYWIIEI